MTAPDLSPARLRQAADRDEAEAAAAPGRLWLSAADEDGEREIWFDPDEGGTEYIRADLTTGEPT